MSLRRGLIRLPLYVELDEAQQQRVIDAITGLMMPARRGRRAPSPAVAQGAERIAALAA